MKCFFTINPEFWVFYRKGCSICVWGCWNLDLGDVGFWILEILGRSRGSNTRQFGDGAWRSEAWILPGLPLGATSKPTVSDRVGARKEIELQKRGAGRSDYMLHSLELISRCLRACFGYCTPRCLLGVRGLNLLWSALGATAKPTISDRVGARTQIKLQRLHVSGGWA